MYDGLGTKDMMMGGIGSGARRSKYAGNIEDTLALDIRSLRRLEVLRAGECVCDTIRWSIDGLVAPKARLRVDLEDVARGGVMVIVAEMPGATFRQRIAIAAIPSAFGGWRCYFICPVTARRCEILYYAEGRFASREAQRVSYAVQNLSELSRARRKAAKLRSRLCGSHGMPRARGRNRIDVVERLSEAEQTVESLYLERLRNVANGSATRTVPKRRS